MRQKAYKKIDSFTSMYTIQNLKSFTNYNITIQDSSGEYSLLSKPIRTYFDSKNILSKKEYEDIYKDKIDTMKNKPHIMPFSWSADNKTRAEVKDAILLNSRKFYIHEEVIDTEPKDGINDKNNDEYFNGINVYYKNLKRFNFKSYGIRVFECPHEPNYFNVDAGQAMLGKKQCYIELGKEKVYKTLADLDELDNKHKFDIFKEAFVTSSKIVLSASTDVITIASFGTALPEVEGIKSFFKIFFENVIKPGKIATANIVFSNIEGAVEGVFDTAGQIIGGSFPKVDLNEFGQWLVEKAVSTFIPCVGTYDLLIDLTEIKSTITETRDENFSSYLLDGLVGANDEISGVFFNLE